MNLYKVTNLKPDWDRYLYIIVVSRDESEAVSFRPKERYGDDWPKSPNDLTVELIGLALPGATVGIIADSFLPG